ncbi:MAG: hypothetical protein Q8M29_04475 [Bacteroidota bacterium]|nr:hypothetical protein [Bacteroidota bacterium]
MVKSFFLIRSDDRVNTYLEDFRYSSIEQTRAFIDRIQKEVADRKPYYRELPQKTEADLLEQFAFEIVQRVNVFINTNKKIVV